MDLIFLRIAVIFLWAFISIRVYYHAKERGLPAVGWALLVFFTGLLVLLLYYLFARNYEPLSEIGGVTDRGFASTYRPGKHYQDRAFMPYGAPGPGAETADPDFVDEELERLINEGDLREARRYLNDMMQIAREVHDKKGLLNLRTYEKRIADASKSGSGSARSGW